MLQKIASRTQKSGTKMELSTRGALLVVVHARIVKPIACLLKQRIYARFFESCSDIFFVESDAAIYNEATEIKRRCLHVILSVENIFLVSNIY